MPRGGRGTRPPRRPLGASGGYEQYGSRHRESTPVYDDGDIELFLDNFRGYAEHMGWTMTHTIERLRGADRFAEPIAQIRREARTWPEAETRMQELRPSPVGPDGRPLRLEIGNVKDFIPAFEQFMHGQGILRDEWARTLPLWTRKAERPLDMQIRDMARDWESCRAHLREAFRRPEPPQPRVERRQRSKRQRDPEPREARPSRGGRKALAKREEELVSETEGRGAYSKCGLGPVEFHRFTEGGLGGSPQRTREEMPASGEPLQELEAHLDVSRWRVPPMSEGRDEPAEEVPREEVQDPEREMRPSTERGHAVEEVIEVEEDTPPQTPAMGLRLGSTPEGAHGRKKGLWREEIPLPPPETAPSPGGRVEMERESPNRRREALAMIDRHLAAHALEHPGLEEPVPKEPPQEPRQAKREMGAEVPGRADQRTRERVPTGETTEEKWVRVRKRLEEIWQERQRLEEAGALPHQPAPPKPYGIKEMWDEFLDQHSERLMAPERAEVGTSRKADEYLDRKIRFLAKTPFDRYLMLEADLAGKKMKEVSHGVRLEAVEAEVRELRGLVASQAAIIHELRQQPQGGADRTDREGPAKVVDRAESSRCGEQTETGYGLSGQLSAIELPQGSSIGKTILEPEEAKTKGEAEREGFEFRISTEFTTLPVAVVEPTMATTPLSVGEGLQTASSEPVQGSAEGSMDILLKAVGTM
ncbi:hypothetical protein CBR_g17623 [Chara braunii]|uniref:Uncharacterized protein n=1 Tax=Chara braunii TaxID=69332 RepID=A0A388KV81_CHABU|nr:hypothetical protein CBR_g17623 [Chara braunii]|eukprot:GBG73908.1 hypothetical protein CBR_g17623 [Chara braunii]